MPLRLPMLPHEMVSYPPYLLPISVTPSATPERINWYFYAHMPEHMLFPLPRMLFPLSEMPVVDLQAQPITLYSKQLHLFLTLCLDTEAQIESSFIVSSSSPSPAPTEPAFVIFTSLYFVILMSFFISWYLSFCCSLCSSLLSQIGFFFSFSHFDLYSG